MVAELREVIVVVAVGARANLVPDRDAHHVGPVHEEPAPDLRAHKGTERDPARQLLGPRGVLEHDAADLLPRLEVAAPLFVQGRQIALVHLLAPRLEQPGGQRVEGRVLLRVGLPLAGLVLLTAEPVVR